MTTEITLSKGGITVTIYADQVVDGFKNKFMAMIQPPTPNQNQPNGPTQAKLIDMLVITRTFTIKGYIVPQTIGSARTADEVKKYLIQICKGANTSGGPITMTYEAIGEATYTSSTTEAKVYCESCIVTENSRDFDPGSSDTNISKFDVSLTLMEGEKI